MIQSASHLASLIGSRICHDLISPICAIHNGLELISLSGPVQHEAEISLITQSCQNAASRIKFFRVAFGASGSDRQLSTDTLLDILMPLINGEPFDEKIAFTETANPLKDNAPPKVPNTKSVRTSKWKLIFNQYDNTKELYNLIQDPNEEHNLIGNSLDIENELWAELKKLDVL